MYGKFLVGLGLVATVGTFWELIKRLRIIATFALAFDALSVAVAVVHASAHFVHYAAVLTSELACVVHQVVEHSD